MRFIPTYVGHTVTHLYRDTPSSVHPHIRGAYAGTCLTLCRCCGSSPHTWGIHSVLDGLHQRSRFIPTYVGHTGRKCNIYCPGPVHPHIRGAYRRRPPCPWPPLRFIPTYVGHTGPWTGTASLPPVHPHIRGAYMTQCSNPRSINGSSPHTWGIPVRQDNDRHSGRFIPTYVGHTLLKSGPKRRTSGSSPHTWGIPAWCAAGGAA